MMICGIFLVDQAVKIGKGVNDSKNDMFLRMSQAAEISVQNHDKEIMRAILTISILTTIA